MSWDWQTKLTGPRLLSTAVRFELFFTGAKTGPNPRDRGKNGSKRHVISDGKGIPLAVIHTRANVHDSQQAIALVDAIPAIKRPHGGRRRRPNELYADRAYDAEAKIREPLRVRKIIPIIAKRYPPQAADWVGIAPSSKVSLPGSSSNDDSESDIRSVTTSIWLSSTRVYYDLLQPLITFLLELLNMRNLTNATLGKAFAVKSSLTFAVPAVDPEHMSGYSLDCPYLKLVLFQTSSVLCIQLSHV